MDNDPKPDHERLIAKLEERLDVEPSWRRARSRALATSTAALGGSERSVVCPSLWDSVVRNTSVPLDYESDHEEEREQEALVEELEADKEGAPLDDKTSRSVRTWVPEDGALEKDGRFDGHKTLDGGALFETDGTPWNEEDKEGRQGSTEVATGIPERQWPRNGNLVLGSQSFPDDQRFLLIDWDIDHLT